MMYFTYVLYSPKYDRIYTGHTDNMEKRLERHNLGLVTSTKAYRPWGAYSSLVTTLRCHLALRAVIDYLSFVNGHFKSRLFLRYPVIQLFTNTIFQYILISLYPLYAISFPHQVPIKPLFCPMNHIPPMIGLPSQTVTLTRVHHKLHFSA